MGLELNGPKHIPNITGSNSILKVRGSEIRFGSLSQVG